MKLDDGRFGQAPGGGAGRAGESPLATARADHWDTVYLRRGADAVSWWQPDPRTSLALVENLGLARDASLIDVGGGASMLAGRLVERGFCDVTVLDISKAALDVGRGRLGEHSAVTWQLADLLSWHPDRRYDLWHDRALFHFLVEQEEREHYVATLRRALEPDGYVILATFALDGPEQCSGLPVIRYSPDSLGAVLGGGFVEMARLSEQHETPAGGIQPFTWLVARASEVIG